MTTKANRDAVLREWHTPLDGEDETNKTLRESVAALLECLCNDIDELESRLNTPAVDWEKVEKDFRAEFLSPSTAEQGNEATRLYLRAGSGEIVGWFRTHIEGLKP